MLYRNKLRSVTSSNNLRACGTDPHEAYVAARFERRSLEFGEESKPEVMMWAWSCLVFVRDRVAAHFPNSDLHWAVVVVRRCLVFESA